MNKIILIISVIILIIIGGLLIFYQDEDKEEVWVTSGPFEIDKSEYNVGEKIFLTVSDLKPEDKGEVHFLRPYNGTHHVTHTFMPFDGMNKAQFNYYLEPRINEYRKICSMNDLAGDWIVEFRELDYEDIDFKILNKTSSWDDREFEPVC